MVELLWRNNDSNRISQNVKSICDIFVDSEYTDSPRVYVPERDTKYISFFTYPKLHLVTLLNLTKIANFYVMEQKKKKINSRQKGAAGERELSNYLIAKGWQARRGQQFSGGTDSPDVVSSFPFHIEAKRVEKLDIDDAFSQAYRDAANKLPACVCHRRNREDWLVTIELIEFLKLDVESRVRSILHRSGNEGTPYLVTLPLCDLLDALEAKLLIDL